MAPLKIVPGKGDSELGHDDFQGHVRFREEKLLAKKPKGCHDVISLLPQCIPPKKSIHPIPFPIENLSIFRRWILH